MEENTQLTQEKSFANSFFHEGANSTPLAIIVGSFIIAGAVLLGSTDANPFSGMRAEMGAPIADEDAQVVPSESGVQGTASAEGEPFIGNMDAPVTMFYWADFQCPFCKRFDLETLPKLVEQYANTGKLKIVIKDFQFLGPDSTVAGIAAHAVWELYPDKYYMWHQAMYEAQDEEHGGFGNEQSIIQLTGNIPGMDASRVQQLMNEKRAEYEAEQDADKEEGTGLGVRGTPGFLIGSQMISGAVPLQSFTDAIEKELAE